MALSYNVDTHQFELPIDGDSVTLLISFPFGDKDSHGNVFEVGEDNTFSFQEWTKDVAENDIHCVKVISNEKGIQNYRIGWLFPYAALTSTEHDFAENPHFLFYAFHAYVEILKDRQVLNRLLEGVSFESIIDEKVANNKNVLIIENTNLLQNTKLKELELSLYMYGYTQGVSINSSKFLQSVNDDVNTIVLRRCKDVLKPQSSSYISSYIDDFLSTYIGENNAFILFLFIYQLFELLLDDILITKLKELIDKVDKGTASTRQIDRQLQDSTESKRLAAILDNSKIKKANYKSLKKLCNDFIPERENDFDLPECIYQVRNRVVHRFRMVANDEMAMKNINEELLLFIQVSQVNKYQLACL